MPVGGGDFTKAMRARSRGIHDTSDALVNAKLGITMSDDSVWAEGRSQHHTIAPLEERVTPPKSI